MSVTAIQRLLAAVFLVLGGWCVIAPESVLDLTIRPQFRVNAPIESFLTAGFGAQALIAGLFAATARFTRTTFMAYGLALLPFLVFDYWFYRVEPVLTPIGLIDAVGNLIMLALCYAGWRRAERV